jgi:hypothetical protein
MSVMNIPHQLQVLTNCFDFAAALMKAKTDWIVME